MPATAPHRSGATAASDVFSAIDSVPARAIPAASSNSRVASAERRDERAGRLQVVRGRDVQERGEGLAVCGEGGAAQHRPGRDGGRERVRDGPSPGRRLCRHAHAHDARHQHGCVGDARRRAGRRTTAVPTRRHKSRSPRRGATGRGRRRSRPPPRPAPTRRPVIARSGTLPTGPPASATPPRGMPSDRRCASPRVARRTPRPPGRAPPTERTTRPVETAGSPWPKSRLHRRVNGDSPSRERRLGLGGGRARALLPADGLTQPQPVAPLRLAGDGVQRARPPRPRARGRAAARTPAEPVGLVRDQQPPPHLGHARHHVRDRLVVPL